MEALSSESVEADTNFLHISHFIQSLNGSIIDVSSHVLDGSEMEILHSAVGTGKKVSLPNTPVQGRCTGSFLRVSLLVPRLHPRSALMRPTLRAVFPMILST